ncbi:hypothetical protein DSUL_50045 [Desulfovibrionales bacterium]
MLVYFPSYRTKKLLYLIVLQSTPQQDTELVDVKNYDNKTLEPAIIQRRAKKIG